MDSGHNCEENKTYSKEYDAYYCQTCNEWLEDTCTDRDCYYCINRPSRPNDRNIEKPTA